jgi:hypothetical protein
VCLFFNLQKFIEGSELDNLIAMLVKIFHTFGDFLMGVYQASWYGFVWMI